MVTSLNILTEKHGMFFSIGLYLAIMVGIGLWAKKVRSRPALANTSSFMEEYFLAGRGMGGLALAMSIVTTYTSAGSFIGGPGIAYTLGLGWVLLAMIQVPTTFLTLGLMGKRLATYSKKTGAVTMSDFLRTRYQSKTLAAITSIFMLIFFIAIMLAQFIGGARVLEAATGIPYATGLILFTATVVIYTTVGGFRAVVLTDLVQGFIMIFAAVALLFAVIDAGGGVQSITKKLAEIDAGLLHPTGPDNSIPVPFMLSFWVLVGLGVLGLPQTAQKCMAFENDKALRQAMIIGTISIGFILLCTHLTGAFGRAVLPGLPAGDLIMPTLTVHLMHPLLSGLCIAGVLSAIMSTVSSMLIMSSATLIRDAYIEWHLDGNANLAGEHIIRWASFGITAVLGILVFFLATNPPDLLIWINLFAFSGLEAVFLWPVVLGLYWKKANAHGALCSVIAGVSSFLMLTVLKFPLLGVHAIIPSLLIGAFAFYCGNNLTALRIAK